MTGQRDAYEPNREDRVRVTFEGVVTAYTASSVEVYSGTTGWVWVPTDSVTLTASAPSEPS